MPARAAWWTHVVGNDMAKAYPTAVKAQKDTGAQAPPRSSLRSFIWGDRVRLLERDGEACKVSGRGATVWVHQRHLDGEPLLEVYVIDVGQGDGLLVVTPEGHNLMVDGGNTRSFQNGGKNAADFIDWKFARDYVSFEDRDDPDKTAIRLDAMIATHNDIDHFGGCMDLILSNEKNDAELDAEIVSVENLYHAGLSWWWSHRNSNGNVRFLGEIEQNHYTQLLSDRDSAVSATANLDDPDQQTLNGSWGKFIKAATEAEKSDGSATPLVRLSNQTGAYLSGFAPGEESACTIRVLGPIEDDVSGKPGLKKYPDGDSKNTNGHSVVLRLDYGDRRILLTGDLNTHSQHDIMETYGTGFMAEYMSDVVKGCHHGSHDVSYKFLDGLRPLVTVISSGDAESHDHPRPTVVAASAITGRKLIDTDTDHLIAPLVYMTEVARSVKLSDVGKLSEYHNPTPEYSATRPTGVKQNHDTEDEMSRFRLLLGSSQSKAADWPRVDHAQIVRGLRYGLVNIRTDGQRLFMAQMEEKGGDWAIHILTPEQIAVAR